VTSALTAGRAAAVDVVLPVYGAAADLARCLASVLAHTELGHHRLVVVLDGPQEEERRGPAGAARRAPAGRSRCCASRRAAGFAAAANRGIAEHPDRDAILLNTSTPR
jgi:GT2 family glycosyltransferase